MLLDQIKKINTIYAIQTTQHPPKSHSRQVKLISWGNDKDYILSLKGQRLSFQPIFSINI